MGDTGLKTANLVLRFALEILALAALAYWGWQTGPGLASQVALTLAAPGVFATVWGIFVAPKAPRRLQDPSRLLLELALFALAAAALIVAGSPVLAPLLGALVVAHLALMLVWGQRGL